VDFDPTNDQVPREQHITAAAGRDFGDVTPLRGVFYGGGEHTLEVAVDVDRLADADGVRP
jgi:transglutaminase-like putative cysteine protease